MHNYQSSGQVKNVFNIEEIKKIEAVFEKIKNPYVTKKGNKFYPIGPTHILYKWFYNTTFNKIEYLFGYDIKLCFGSLLDAIHPFDVHSDYYHKTLGNPYKAFLIPLNDYSNTIIFNEVDTFVSTEENKTSNPNLENIILSWPIKENSALLYKDNYLSHIPDNILSRLTVQNVLKWDIGDILFWNEELLHCSDNFEKNNVSRKRALVIHTYKE